MQDMDQSNSQSAGLWVNEPASMYNIFQSNIYFTAKESARQQSMGEPNSWFADYEPIKQLIYWIWDYPAASMHTMRQSNKQSPANESVRQQSKGESQSYFAGYELIKQLICRQQANEVYILQTIVHHSSSLQAMGQSNI